MDKDVYQPLDMSILNGKNRHTISAEKALRDVCIIDWDDEVIAGKRKAMIKEAKCAESVI